MKHILAFCACTLSITAGCAFAQQLTMPSVPITVEAHVRDPNGQPVVGAMVHLALPRYRLGDKGQRVDSITNVDGVATVSGTAQQDYSVSVEKTGYYPTQGPWHGINDEKSFQQYAVGTQKIDLELRPIRTPIRGIVKFVDRLRIPKKDEPVGFDLEVGDWVAPFGKGKAADFVFSLAGYIRSNRDYNLKLTLSFSNPADGLQLAKFPPRIGSAFKFPYEAPLNGYEKNRVWNSAYDGKTMKMNFGPNDETNYLFRVRTELDEKGDVRRALYGVVVGEVFLGGSFDTGQTVTFTYALNPDGTRNIEFDPAKIAVASR
jgi:hypothetical protein